MRSFLSCITVPGGVSGQQRLVRGVLLFAAACVLLLLIADPSLAAPAGGGGGGARGPIPEMFHNLWVQVEDASKSAWLVVLVLGVIVVAITTKLSVPKILAFLIAMVILAPIINNAPGIGQTLSNMGTSIWPSGKSGP